MKVQKGDRIVVTGAAGFIGSSVVRELLALGAHVVAAVEPGGTDVNLKDLDVEAHSVDIRYRADVREVIEGAVAVFHTAALFSFWSPDSEAFYDVNVKGTRNVIESAVEAGCQKIVYTSTVATIGLDGTEDGRPADERVHARIDHLHGHYKQTKYVAEHEVLRATAEGAPITLVHPTFPLGPRDIRPTPTGKVILDYLNGRMPGYVDTAMNVVHVEDLARGHVLALEQGRIGRSYILGGYNVSMKNLLEMAASCSGLPTPKLKLPTAIGFGAGVLSHLVEERLLRREPHVSLEAARMSLTKMIFDSTRAREELGYVTRPALEAVESSVRWFVENDYVNPARARRITLTP